jgi:signal transduction histidine kinase
MLNLALDRTVQTNKFLIKVRWLYILGILLIGILTKTISNSNINLSFFTIGLLIGIAVLFNMGFWYLAKKIEKEKSQDLLNFLGFSQIIFELGMFTIVMHFSGGIESISYVFFFLPVVAASLLVGSRGGLYVGLISGVLINLLVALEYFGIIPHIPRYEFDTIEFISLPIALTKTINISIFYLIVGWFSGYGSDLIFRREKMVEEKSEQMDTQTKMLIRRDIKLLDTNEQLLEERNKVSAIVSNFTDPIIFLDKDFHISLFNQAARTILGFEDKMMGEQISDRKQLSMDNFKRLISFELSAKPTGDSSTDGFPVEEVVLKKSGEEKIYKVLTASVFNEDKTISYGFIKIFYDLTREKTIDRLKSEFISIAAHQLRTPLTSIKWVIKMALDGDAGSLSDEQKELLSKGYESNERVIKLVNDLLNVSRIEEGRFGYAFDKNDFQEVINTVIENVEGVVAKKHIELAINKPAKLPKIYLDKNKMVMVMQNILDNAIKYSPEYSKINVNIEKTDKFLKVAVIDCGMGIPAKDRDKLFSKFFRASNVAQAEIDGTGLGLFIVKNIIERHGGIISLKSEEGRGTEVSFVIPL